MLFDEYRELDAVRCINDQIPRLHFVDWHPRDTCIFVDSHPWLDQSCIPCDADWMNESYGHRLQPITHSPHMPRSAFTSSTYIDTTYTKPKARPRRQLYSELEWSRIRSAFTESYLTPGFRLEDAMYTMSQRYDFHATYES